MSLHECLWRRAIAARFSLRQRRIATRPSKANGAPPSSGPKEGASDVLTGGWLTVWTASGDLRQRTATKDSALTQNDPNTWPTGTPPSGDYCAEDERLFVLASFEIEALEGDPELARLARFAAHLCGTKQAAVSLVEAERQFFLARTGWDTNATPRSTSICAHTMTGAQILEVSDASSDERFAGFEAVAGSRHLRFYAGAPLISSEGAPLGALCVTDSEPRPEGLSELQREGLAVLAESVMRRIET